VSHRDSNCDISGCYTNPIPCDAGWDDWRNRAPAWDLSYYDDMTYVAHAVVNVLVEDPGIYDLRWAAAPVGRATAVSCSLVSPTILPSTSWSGRRSSNQQKLVARGEA
jgi:hypothetical protein